MTEYALRLGHISERGLEELKRLTDRFNKKYNRPRINNTIDIAIADNGKKDTIIYVDLDNKVITYSSEEYYNKYKQDEDVIELTPFDMLSKLTNLLVKEETEEVKEEPEKDVANQDHYKNQGIEPIEYMRSTFTQDEFRGFLRGNVTKYLARHKDKNGLEDLKKAQVYLGWLIEDWEEEK